MTSRPLPQRGDTVLVWRSEWQPADVLRADRVGQIRAITRTGYIEDFFPNEWRHPHERAVPDGALDALIAQDREATFRRNSALFALRWRERERDGN